MPDQNVFSQLHLETFGKSGIRRVMPGEFIATDAKGRAVMIASVEKNKLVYVLSRDSDAKVTISSPLEAHKPMTLVHSLVGLDVGYDNPMFAALETDYSEAKMSTDGQVVGAEKALVYYQLDLGLNHVVRKATEVVDPTANLLFIVPGGKDGPSGVLVCALESITYVQFDQPTCRVPIPRRKGPTENPERRRMVTAGVMHRMRGAFFFLLQTEDGDLFKVTIEMARTSAGLLTRDVACLTIKYFDTIPVSSSLCILRSGFLFLGAESGDHAIYQFERLGERDNELQFNSDDFSDNLAVPCDPVFFFPRPALNLKLAHSLDSMHPLFDCNVTNLTDGDAPQIYTLSGSGARSSFRTLKHGMPVGQTVESQVPGQPVAVWTTKTSADSEYDTYMILSFQDSTLILSIGEQVEEVVDSGFLTHVPTLAVQLIGTDLVVQVHSRGLRSMMGDVKTENDTVMQGEVLEWATPQHRSIVAAATNERQVVIALNSGELVYFEFDEATGTLSEYSGDRPQMDGTVTALSMGSVPEGRKRSSFLAVGCDDATVRILSLDLESILVDRSIQALTAAPSSLAIIPMVDSSSGGVALYVHIGLDSGVHLRTVIDQVTGDLDDTRSRFLGPKPVRLCPITVGEQECILALSSRPWIGYAHPETKSFTLTPLDCPPIECVTMFRSEELPEGIVAVSPDQILRLSYIEDLSTNIQQDSIPLLHTGREIVQHPTAPIFFAICSDPNTLGPESRKQLLDEAKKSHDATNGNRVETNGDHEMNGDRRVNGRKGTKGSKSADPDSEMSDDADTKDVEEDSEMDEDGDRGTQVLPPDVFGHPKANKHWASQICVIDPLDQKKVIHTVDLDNNEAAVSVAIIPLAEQDDEAFLMVGTSKDTDVCGYMHLYRINDDMSLEFIHKTRVAAPPRAIRAFHGRALVGIGPDLFIYDAGMKQMLRKAQALNAVPHEIMGITTQGSRVVCADRQESVSYVIYDHDEGRLVPFADDSLPRWCTTTPAMLDYETVTGGDRFGNMWAVRCPTTASDEADEEGGAAHMIYGKKYLHGAKHRLDCVMHFHVNDIPMAVHKTSLVAGGREVILWAGLEGTIGLLIPFAGREEVDFFQDVENRMRKEAPSLTGRDHLAYRGYYVPVKGVIDGDLCERFARLDRGAKERVSAGMDRSVRDMEKRISEMRTRVAF
ncbi:putative nuclear mRNA splicing factor [Aulographum hederae CBS 113979]|uniref:Putative nuclear mRNA splicing factor n=1 Tax=Aulographum hederae CBS 113979 TaxID=1176131 RepID=A0A6G1H019_9PEZI|nr:putative nuclear mRNA splicing factor [Aulographum hederae CBS 113979]